MDHDPKVLVIFEVVSVFLYVQAFEGRALSTLFQVFGYLGIAAASLLIVVRMYALPILCVRSRPGQDLIDSFSVAIWNKNKIAIAIATSLWVTNVAVIIQGKSSAPSSRPLSIPSRRDIPSGIARVNKQHRLPCIFYAYPYIQLRAEWNTFLPGCIIFNSHSGKLNIIVTLIVDVMLLLIVLVGLLRWRSDGLGMFGIGRLLWKQVRCRSFPSAVVPSFICMVSVP